MFRMPSRVTPGHARDGDSPARSATPLSESERSFVSAESENTTSKRPCVDQSALSPSSSRRAQDAVSNTSSSPSSAFQQPTPLASRQASSSNTLKPTPSRSGPPAESYFSSQPSSGFESRSPGYKRPPASRSSHGIETRSGPPPALSTRRSYNADPSWRSSPPTIAELYQLSADGSIDWSLTDNAHEIDGGAKQAGSWPSAGMRSSQGGDLKGRTLAPTEDDPDPTLRVNGQKMRVSRGNGHQNQQQEDLFLNLARTDSVADDGSDTMSRVERRRSRLGNSASKPSRPSSSGRPNSSGARFFGHHASQTRFPPSGSFDSPLPMTSLASLRDEASRDRPYAASAHPLDQRHHARYSGLNSKIRSSSPQQENGDYVVPYSRRRSINTPSHTKYNSSPIRERPSSMRGNEAASHARQGDGTESTVSTTAPSTVWDELDDLKSRIRKIEVSGNLPSTSNAAISTAYGERPVTATTTLTTMSSSPKRRVRASASPEGSTIQEQPIAELHPILHSALAKAKTTITPTLYKALEATASDALALAAISGVGRSNAIGNTQTNGAMVDRQIRRKADSMCRSLTELCISLAENNKTSEEPTKSRPGNRDVANSTPQRLEDPRLSRAVSEDPELRASSRVMSRLEARRTSLLFGQQSPQDSSQPEISTPTPDRPPIVSKLERTSSVIRRRDDDNNNNDESIVGRRPVSRAATEVGSLRPSPQTRTSREYTSQHPMPNLTHRSPSVQTSIPTRKSFFPSPSSQSPITPTVQPGSRRYLDRSTPPSTDSNRLAEARQRRIASLGPGSSATAASKIGVPSAKLRHLELQKG